MIPEFIHSIYGSVKLLATRSKKSNQLPGSTVYTAEEKQARFEVQQYHHPLFSIGHRLLHFFKKLHLTIREKEEGIRLEAVLTGELPTVSSDGEPITIKPGQYHLSTNPAITALFKKDTACRYFITHYSKELLDR